MNESFEIDERNLLKEDDMGILNRQDVTTEQAIRVKENITNINLVTDYLGQSKSASDMAEEM